MWIRSTHSPVTELTLHLTSMSLHASGEPKGKWCQGSPASFPHPGLAPEWFPQFLYLGCSILPLLLRLCQGYPLSLTLFAVFMYSILRCSWAEEGLCRGNFRVASLLFVDAVKLLASASHDLWCTLKQFAAEWQAAGMRVGPSKSAARLRFSTEN